MFNTDIRQEIRQAGLYEYQVAEKMGVCEMTFIRKLRHELPPEEKARVRQIIKDLAAN